MRNAAISTLKTGFILGPAEIKSLEELAPADRYEALLKLGAPKIRQAIEQWRDAASTALNSERELLAGQAAFFITASREERRIYSARLDDADGDLKQADSIIEKLDGYLDLVEQGEMQDGVRAFAVKLNDIRDSRAAELLAQAKQGLTILADVVAKAKQFNFEASQVNKVLPAGCDGVPQLGMPMHGSPRSASLYAEISTFFPIIPGPNEEPIGPAPVDQAALPDAVKSALEKVDMAARASFAAARVQRRGEGGAPEPGAWTAPVVHALPPREPEPVASERGFQPGRHLKPGASE
jgi:hypothetical protein